MGEQRKKLNSLQIGTLTMVVALVVFLMSVGASMINTGTVVVPVSGFNATGESSSESEEVQYWGREDGYFEDFAQRGDKVYYIRSAKQLAYLSYVLNTSGAIESTEDYSGCVFVLENDIYLDKLDVANPTINGTTDGDCPYVYPLWTPIDVGILGKNKNITFDGNHHSIIGMRIEYNDTSEACNAGFFANIIGGVIKNVNFINPSITYSYWGSSIDDAVPSRPKAPTDVCIGVVAGEADSTYVENVRIINPTISLSVENVNAHNFYVGTAVGKLSFNSHLEEEEVLSVNTVTPNKWGLDTVNVNVFDKNELLQYKDTVPSIVKLTVKKGNMNGVTYGKATYGYLGGLVGANISSKIINSTLRDFEVIPQIDTNAAGTYYIGGIVGLTTQIASAERLIVAAGVYNNLLINVNLGNIAMPNDGTYYCGNLVGRVYAGGWVYNNIVIGNHMPYAKLWGDISNASIHVGGNADDEKCVGHILGALDRYYFDNNDNYIGDKPTSKCHFVETSDGLYRYCSTHQPDAVSLLSDAYASESDMSNYNFYFSSVDDSNYRTFMETEIDGEGAFTKFQLMSNIDENKGFLFYASRPIIKYEIGLTVNAKNPDTNNDATDYEKLLDAIYQFRTWSKSGEEPKLSDSYFGSDCSITFVANADDAYFEVPLGYGYFDKVTEKKIARSYQQIIYEPSPEERPVRNGYEFIGWQLEGGDSATNSHIGADGLYNFDGTERVTEPNLRFLAVWRIRTRHVTYMLREYEDDGITYHDTQYRNVEEVVFNERVSGFSEENQPVSPKRYEFIGWFEEEYLPTPSQDADSSKRWKFDEYRMPDRDLVLYAGWKDNFTVLNDKVDNEYYKKYAQNYQLYFDDILGENYYQAYNAAANAEKGADVSVLLTNLENAFKALKVDPKKLKNTDAFDETLAENKYPFLYEPGFYGSYVTQKNKVKKFAEDEQSEAILKNIEGFIEDYENINRLFSGLKNHLKSSFADGSGEISTQAENLIARYQELEETYESLYQNGDYTKYDMTALDEKELVTKQNLAKESYLVLSDVESLVADYESALRNLQVKSIVNEIENNGESIKEKSSKSSKLGISPVVLSIILVLVLVAGVIGYIGIDVVLNKRRSVKKNSKKNSTNQTQTPDDETYI